MRPVRCGASDRTTVSTSGSSGTLGGYFEEDVVAVDVNGEGLDADGRVEVIFAGAAVVLPGVPRADEHVAVEGSLAERAAGMRASAVESVQGSARVTDGVRPAMDFGFEDGSRGELGEGSDFDEGHRFNYRAGWGVGRGVV